ncbi:MAG: hypothetical protein LBL52_01195 [Rickettsiales bacterium]|jgi:hypothetical protein|nr:hypothetical protein [Rickettsiales bacterium]
MFRFLTTILCLAAFAPEAMAARATPKKSSGNSSRKTNNDSVKEDCATKFIAALDSECFNTVKIHEGGVYADCDHKTAAELYDIMEMKIAGTMDTRKVAPFLKTCAPFKSYALDRWYGSRSVVENAATKGSGECLAATKKLNAAKKCYAAAIAHDGNFFEFESLMKHSCGDQPEVANKFSKAGDIGFSNLPQIIDNYASMQFTNKASNWRTAVEAVLAGYIYTAQAACGEDAVYDLVEFNKFTPDTRGNLLHEMQKGFVNQFGAQLGSRAENAIITGQPVAQNPTPPTMAVPYQQKPLIQINLPGSVQARQKYKAVDDFGNPYPNVQRGEQEKIGYVYLVDNVRNISTARARLINIVINEDIGDEGYRDELDNQIIIGLGGRAHSSATEVLALLDSVVDNDVFILTSNGMCQILKLSDDRLRIMSKLEVGDSLLVNGYLTKCREIIE